MPLVSQISLLAMIRTVSANPNGAACYDASVLYHSSSPKTAKEVHELGLQQIALLTAEMKAIGEASFGSGDVTKLLQQLRTDPKYRFKSREEKIAYSQAALARAKAAVPTRFGLLPKADVVIQPYPKFREKNAPNEYNPGAEDGSRPAVFFISAYQAETQSRAEDESTAFHETIPGHHLQGSIALERKEIHPIGISYLFTATSWTESPLPCLRESVAHSFQGPQQSLIFRPPPQLLPQRARV